MVHVKSYPTNLLIG